MRISGRGLIDRGEPLGFSFDGRTYQGFRGDTLASALLANGVRLMGRSFKYHRPRGVLTAGPEEPNALVEVLEEGQQTPNVRATVQELYQGLAARSQNRWPSLRTDALAVNDLLSPFFSAGFYYKTFMWPRAFWERLYEPAIRRAAGLGSLSGRHDEGRYEKAFAFCDLLVIGSGPAGLMAALVAGRSGADVILAEDEARMGGRVLSDAGEIDGRPGPDWVADVLAELAALPNVRLMPRTTVTGAYDGGTFSAVERVSLHLADPGGLPRECLWRIVARRTVLAAGALERPIAFPDNDRPGIMLASAVRSYLNRYGVAAGKRVAVLTNNDGARRTAEELSAAGVEIAAVIDTRPDASALGDYPLFRGARVIATEGRLGLSSLTVEDARGERKVEADCLAVSGGWNPTLHLNCHQGGRPVWDAGMAAFLPRDGAVPGLAACGAAAGIFSTAGCLADGAKVAKLLLGEIGMACADRSFRAQRTGHTRFPRFGSSRGKGGPGWISATT